MESLKTLRDRYAEQLKGVDADIQAAEQKLNHLSIQREQLKGAIFALDTLSSSEEKAKQIEKPTETQKNETNTQENKEG